MKVTTETVATREVLLTIEPDPETIQRAMRRAARELSRLRPIAGYRPGRAPFGMVERVFGRETILHEALHDIAPDLYREAIREADVRPYEQTLLDIESEEPLVLKLQVPLVPEVTLGDYSELTIEPEPEVVITDEDIQEQIEMLRRQHAEMRPVERPLQMGDQFTALLTRTVDGEVLERNQEVVIDMTDDVEPAGFAEALTGAVVNEIREFSLTFPEDHADEDLAGKKVDYRVAIGEIREVVLPEADDEFAKTVGDYETLEELTTALSQELREQREEEAKANERRRALDALVAITEMEYPAAALEREIDRVLNQQARRFMQMGFTMEGYLRMRGITEEELREEVREDCERNLRQRLTLIEYVRKEGISLTPEEGNEAFTRYTNAMVAAYGDQAGDRLREEIQHGALDLAYEDSLLFKASQHLADKLTGRLVEEEDAASGEPTGEDAGGAEATADEAVAENVGDAEAAAEEQGETPAEA